MNTKVATVLGIASIAIAIMLFAAAPIVATHQAWACGYCGCRGGYVYGFYYGSGG